MPEASLTKKNEADKAKSVARREAKKWLISADFLIADTLRYRLQQNPANSSHFLASQGDDSLNPAPLTKSPRRGTFSLKVIL